MTKKSWAFRDLVAAISAALHETFVRSKYANSVSHFLLNLWRFCLTTEGISGVLLSFLCLWNVGHLNGILARVGGNLKNNFQKSQMHVGLLGRGGWSFNLTDTLFPLLYAQASCTNYMQLTVAQISPLATLIIPSVPCHSRPLQWLSRGWSLTNYTIHGCCSGH